MRFKANIQNATTFYKVTASLASLGHVAWVRLNSDDVRFTIIPEQGTQVWAVLAIDTIFETYTIQSASPNNTINLEVPLQPLLRALKSASIATSASIRLTKKDGIPWLVVTILTTSFASSSTPSSTVPAPTNRTPDSDDPFALPENTHMPNPHMTTMQPHRERETHVTLDIPVIVLAPAQVAGLHEPHCRDPDVYIYLPPLSQLKSVSDRFARLAGASMSTVAAETGASSVAAVGRRGGKSPRLELAATMHGVLRLSYNSDALKISSTWRGLENPDLDPEQVDGGEGGLRELPSTRMRAVVPDEDDDEAEGWAKVRIDARDWGRVMSVGRVGGKVIACFCQGHALILYVYLPSVDEGPSGGGDESVLTYYVSSYSS